MQMGKRRSLNAWVHPSCHGAGCASFVLGCQSHFFVWPASWMATANESALPPSLRGRQPSNERTPQSRRTVHRRPLSGHLFLLERLSCSFPILTAFVYLPLSPLMPNKTAKRDLLSLQLRVHCDITLNISTCRSVRVLASSSISLWNLSNGLGEGSHRVDSVAQD